VLPSTLYFEKETAMADEQEADITGYATEKPDGNNGVTFLLVVGVIATVGLVASGLSWLFG